MSEEKYTKIIKESFSVIGKEGSTHDGDGFIGRLWDDANAHFSEVQHLAKRDGSGVLCGIWGVMSDFSRSFNPWENFSEGLYLAGVECVNGAEAPDGWVKWTVPGYEYIRAENVGGNVFSEVLEYLECENLTLAGAVHDFTCPTDRKSYMLFPVKKI